MKSFHMSVVDLTFRNKEFCKFVAVSTTCSTGLLLSHMRSIESSLLKIVSQGGMVAPNRNGGTEKVKHDV